MIYYVIGTLPEQRFPDDRYECDGKEDECERH